MTIADRSCNTLAHDVDLSGACNCGFELLGELNHQAHRIGHVLQAKLPIFLRKHEVLLWASEPLVHSASGLPLICAVHGQLRNAMFAWDHRITTDHAFGGRPHRIGEDRFSGMRPASGDEPCGGTWSSVLSDFHAEQLNTHDPIADGWWKKGDAIYRPGTGCSLVPMCRDCGRYCTVVTKQEAYGDRSTCRSCGAEHYFSIGD
jgi:hypothetical protein